MQARLATRIRELTSAKWWTEVKLVTLLQAQIRREWSSAESKGWANEVTDKEARKVIRYLEEIESEREARKAGRRKPRALTPKQEDAATREAMRERIAEQARTFDPAKVKFFTPVQESVA